MDQQFDTVIIAASLQLLFPRPAFQLGNVIIIFALPRRVHLPHKSHRPHDTPGLVIRAGDFTSHSSVFQHLMIGAPLLAFKDIVGQYPDFFPWHIKRWPADRIKDLGSRQAERLTVAECI